MSYTKTSKRYHVSIQQGTNVVPADGKYHVVFEGKIILSTKVLDYALLVFDEKVDECRKNAGHPDPVALRQQEDATRTLRALRADGVSARERRNRGSGPGGRGGI
jgi:hypothetical protein